MNYDRISATKNLEKYRTMETYYGAKNCLESKGLETLAVGNQVVESFDYGNCKVVVPTEQSMSYGKIFDKKPNSSTYKGYYSVVDGYYAGQENCGNYRLRNCQ